MKFRTIGAFLIVSALGVAGSHAQIMPFEEDFDLTKGDLDAMGEAVNPMLDDPKIQPGAKTRWKNEKTGSSGRVDYIKAKTIQGLPCKTIRYNIKLAKPQQLHRFVIDYCKVEDGTWKSYP